MEYGYNYSHLRQFMQKHNLSKRDILEAIGSKDYVSLNKWIEGKNPVHIAALCKLCNYYQEPLENFFYDKDGLPEGTKSVSITPAMPTNDTQELPTDNHRMRNGAGKITIETHITHRNIGSVSQAKAVEEGLKRQREQQERRKQFLQNNDLPAPNQENTTNENFNSNSYNELLNQLRIKHSEELRTIEKQNREKEDRIRDRFDLERDRLLSIIEQQSSEIARLPKESRGSQNITK